MEADAKKEDQVTKEQLGDFMTKLLLRVYGSCPLLAGYIEKEWVGDGVLELVFHDVPDTVRAQMVTLFGGCPYEEFRFSDGHNKLTGYRLKPRPSDVSDLEVLASPGDNEDPKDLKVEPAQEEPKVSHPSL